MYVLFSSLLADGEDVLGVHEENGVTYPSSFFGSHLVDWLISTGAATTRDLALKEGRKYLESDIIRHGKKARVCLFSHDHTIHIDIVNTSQG